jgi:hypothetical protein
LEAFYKKKMATDSDKLMSDNMDDDKSFDDQKRENNYEGLNLVYEKLVNFVVDKPEFKLRYFEALESESKSNDEDYEEEREFDHEEGRNSSIKCSYVQIKLELEDMEPVDIFMKQRNSNLLLTIQHDLISENVSSNWLKSFAELECQLLVTSEELNSNWLAPSKLQPDHLNFVQDLEAYNETFSTLKDALQLWGQLQNLVQDQEEKLQFDRNAPNELICNNSSLRAQITKSSITWTSVNENDSDLICSLNTIGSKYRSILDCLKAQLELLQTHQ